MRLDAHELAQSRADLGAAESRAEEAVAALAEQREWGERWRADCEELREELQGVLASRRQGP